MPEVARELSVIYGAITVGGTTERLLDGDVEVYTDSDSGRVSFAFVAGNETFTEGTFQDEIVLLESEFRDPRQRLRIVQGAETLHDWNPADTVNTGFNHRPSLTFPPHPANSGRTRYCQVTIDFDLPADEYDQSGRRDSSVTLVYTPARRKVLTVEGEYRALTTEGSARDQYSANIDTYVSAILGGTATPASASISGTFELAEEHHQSDDTDKICTFRRVYEEVILNQAQGVLNHAGVVRQEMRVTTREVAPGDSPGLNVSRFAELTTRYSAWIDRDHTTDLVGFYEGTLRPWIIQHTLDRFRASNGALVDEAPEYDGPENRISCTITLIAKTGGDLVQFTSTTELFTDYGIVLVPVWTGKVYDKYVYQGPRRAILTISNIEKRVGKLEIKSVKKSSQVNKGFSAPKREVNQGPFGGGAGPGVKPSTLTDPDDKERSVGQWYLMSKKISTQPTTLGLSGRQLNTTDVNTVAVYEWASKPVAAPSATPQKKPRTGTPHGTTQGGFGKIGSSDAWTWIPAT